MFAGIGVIGALASTWPGLHVSPAPPTEDGEGDESNTSTVRNSLPSAAVDSLRADLAKTREEMAEPRRLIGEPSKPNWYLP